MDRFHLGARRWVAYSGRSLMGATIANSEKSPQSLLSRLGYSSKYIPMMCVIGLGCHLEPKRTCNRPNHQNGLLASKLHFYATSHFESGLGKGVGEVGSPKLPNPLGEEAALMGTGMDRPGCGEGAKEVCGLMGLPRASRSSVDSPLRSMDRLKPPI